jgi:UDPglucose 6-dehydrogenase
MGLDRRIGPKFLHPGPGFGGSCFPKDLSALIQLGQKHGLPMRIAEAASEVNQVQRKLLVQKTKALLNGTEGKVVGVLGLSFKPNTDDVRESPAIFVCRELAQSGARVQAYDPVAMRNAKGVLNQKGVSFCATAYEAASAADVLVIATEWNEFRNIDLSKVKSLMRQPIILDSRNIFEPDKVRNLGFTYSSTGRSK